MSDLPLPRPQYSEKEDKYEEEIKLLNDKLKEVRGRGRGLASARASLHVHEEADCHHGDHSTSL